MKGLGVDTTNKELALIIEGEGGADTLFPFKGGSKYDILIIADRYGNQTYAKSFQYIGSDGTLISKNGDIALSSIPSYVPIVTFCQLASSVWTIKLNIPAKILQPAHPESWVTYNAGDNVANGSTWYDYGMYLIIDRNV